MSPKEIFALSSLIVFLLLSISIVLFTIAFSRRFRKHRKNIDEIRKKNEASLLRATLSTQENERERIGANLHDDIGPLLSSLKMYFKNEMKMDYRNDKDEVQQIINVIDENIEHVRDISRDLVPNVLKQFGLKASIEELKRKIEKSSEVKIEIQFNDQENIPGDETLSLYRIIQEGVNNAIRHGNATQVDIKYSSVVDFLQLSITDNGEGFNIDTNNPGLGLRNIEARAKSIDADININSDIGKGTSIIITRRKAND